MKKITLLISVFAFIVSGFAQNRVANPHQNSFGYNNSPTHRTCGTPDAMERIRSQDPAAYDANLILKEQELQNWIANNYDPNAKKAIIRIPVVVQIWENSSTVPDIRVTQQITRLNDDFRRTNSDAGNTPGVFSAVDCEIEFCLATVGPNGNATTGIIRKTVGGSPAQSGGSDLWNTTKYLNLFVYNIGGGTLGFTYLASQSPNQAVHITTGAFGNTGGQFGMGRTASHEVGHWLNLSHIWGDANCGNDFVNDTPTQQTSNYNCPSHPSASCGNSGDMFMNYMDYVNDNCMNAFTAGQKARMIAAINNNRSGLLTSSGINCGAIPLTADFTESATTISAGQTITFTDASSGPNTINSWNWNFDVTSNGGVSPATANTQGTHVVTYNTPGTYTVSLIAGDGSATDTKTKNQYITVLTTGATVCDSTAASWDFATHAASTGVSSWSGGDGYILGQNTYGDNGWADKITYNTLGKELTNVLYYFGVGTGSGNFNYKVWGDVAGLPNNSNVMAQQTASISSVTTTGAPTLWTLSSAVALNGDFYIGYDHSSLSNGDTLVAYSAQAGTNTTFANETTGWIDLAAYLTNGVSMAIIPVICDISTGEKEILGQLNNVLIYPNPSVGTLNVALTEKANSTVTVLNMLGEVVASQTKNTQLFTFDINNHPNGVYFIQITTGDKVTTKKVLLTK